MKAAQASKYGDDIDTLINIVHDAKRPTLEDIQDPNDRHNWVVVKVLAVALAPGDVRVLSGRTAKFQAPPSFPYTLGGDLCGDVVECCSSDNSEYPFQIGDRIVRRFYNDRPMDGLAEYALINVGSDKSCCAKLPPNVTPQEGAALASSGIAAMCLAKHIKEGDRVLVLGGAGGVGSHFVQLAKRLQKASWVVGVGSDTKRLLETLEYDDAINYKTDDPFTHEKYINDPFDVVVDFSSGGWIRMVKSYETHHQLTIKPSTKGGKFLTCSLDQAWFDGNTVWEIIKLMWPMIGRQSISQYITKKKFPMYELVKALPNGTTPMMDILETASTGQLKTILDPQSPFPFTKEGICTAMKLQQSCHVKGKATIIISDESSGTHIVSDKE